MNSSSEAFSTPLSELINTTPKTFSEFISESVTSTIPESFEFNNNSTNSIEPHSEAEATDLVGKYVKYVREHKRNQELERVYLDLVKLWRKKKYANQKIVS